VITASHPNEGLAEPIVLQDDNRAPAVDI